MIGVKVRVLTDSLASGEARRPAQRRLDGEECSTVYEQPRFPFFSSFLCDLSVFSGLFSLSQKKSTLLTL